MSNFNRFKPNSNMPFDTYSAGYQSAQPNPNNIQENNPVNPEPVDNKSLKYKQKAEKNEFKEKIRQEAQAIEAKERAEFLRLKEQNPYASKLTDKERQELTDLEHQAQANLKLYKRKSKRNNTIIWTLVILLILTIASIAIYAAIASLVNNCYAYIEGDVDAVYVIDNSEQSRFRAPANIRGDAIYEFDCDIKIKTSASYNIRFKVEIFLSGNLISNTLIYEPNRTLFTLDNDGSYYSKSPISSNGRTVIQLFKGVIIDQGYKNSLNENNFKMVITTYFDKM